MTAYDEIYLEEAMRNLGEAFDYACNALSLDGDEFWSLLAATKAGDSFNKGNPKFIAGLSGTELAIEVLSKSGMEQNFPRPQTEYECSPEYWCGWILAYYQWESNESFQKIHEYLSAKDILRFYPTLHEAPEDKFVDVAKAIASRNKDISRLQKQRKTCGYSQRQLAQKANINLRTLQQYEIKGKDINKASAKTVISLATILGCGVEDILE